MIILAPNRRHAITWTNVYPLHWLTHICGTQGEMPAFCTKSWKYLECSHFFPRVYEEARKWVKSSKFGFYIRQKYIGHLFYITSSFEHHLKPLGEFKLELLSRSAQFRSKSVIFCPMWAWNLMDDLEQGKSEGFESCDWPIVRKRPIWVKIGDVLYRVTLKFDGWPWKTIGHLFFAVSSFVQHFIAIGEFKLELQSGNAQLGWNSTIFRAVWPWNLTDDLEKQ